MNRIETFYSPTKLNRWFIARNQISLSHLVIPDEVIECEWGLMSGQWCLYKPRPPTSLPDQFSRFPNLIFSILVDLVPEHTYKIHFQYQPAAAQISEFHLSYSCFTQVKLVIRFPSFWLAGDIHINPTSIILKSKRVNTMKSITYLVMAVLALAIFTSAGNLPAKMGIEPSPSVFANPPNAPIGPSRRSVRSLFGRRVRANYQ